MAPRIAVFRADFDQDVVGCDYDLVVGSLGYEGRARHVCSMYRGKARHKVAWAFADHRELSYTANANWFSSNGYTIDEGIDLTAQYLNAAIEPGRDASRVLVDISSATRQQIAMWISALEAKAEQMGTSLIADFAYSPAKYNQPPKEQVPNTWAGPVLPSFAGWATDPTTPAVLVVGLGYEPDKALGAVEFLEPAEVIAFVPRSRDEKLSGPQYSVAIEEANQDLWTAAPKMHRVYYAPDQPFPTFSALEGLVARLVERSRPILLPFGPKVFSLVATLTAKIHPAAAVWRVSSGPHSAAIERTPAGSIVCLRARFDPVTDEAQDQVTS